MATSRQAHDKSLEDLRSLVKTTAALLYQLESTLYEIADNKESATDPPTTSNEIDAFSLAHDSASLIKAHSTKISLLIINEPFTPSAIISVIRELVAGPIPGLASAVQVCSAEQYTNVVQRDLAYRCYRVLKEFRGLVEAIPLDGKVLKGNEKDGGAGSITSTGVVWAACDDVILLKKMGIAGLLAKKVEQYRDMLKDVLEELKDWGEEEGEDDDDDDGGGDVANEGSQIDNLAENLNSTHMSTQAMLDDLVGGGRHIPASDPDKIRERLESCLKKLRLTTLLYSAIIKRRIKILPPLTASETSLLLTQRLDAVLPILKRIPIRFEDVAGAFYELDPSAIDRCIDLCFFDAFAVSEMLMKPWDTEKDKDEFTGWVEKFQAEIKKPT